MADLLVSMLWGLPTLCCVMCFGMLPYFGGKYWQKVSDSSRLVLRLCIEWVLSSLLSRIPGLKHYIGSVSQQKLLFVPDADNNPSVEHEISDPALFRFLLNEETLNQFDEPEAKTTQKLSVLKDIDKNWEITEFETHQSSMGLWEDLKGAFHVFIVFKTTSKKDDEDYWWSLEKGIDYIVLQRSRNKGDVKDKYDDEPRKKVKPIKEDLKGKGTIKDLFAVLWAQQMILEKYHIKRSNCQSFVTFVSKQMTQEQYDFKGFFPYSPPESDREKEMLDLINILTGVTDYHPLFTLIYVENTRLFDMITKGGEYNMLGITQYGRAPLQFAIYNSKTKMVQHLLNPPYSADPTTRYKDGQNALHLASIVTQDTTIIDLLLAHHSKVQKASKEGSNEETDDSTAVDKDAAAGVLEAQKVKGTGNVNIRNDLGWTALHCAVMTSNAIIAEHLIRNGADLHCRDNNGHTPLHVAAYLAKDMKIIDVLLKNIQDEEINQYKEDPMLLCYAYCNEQHKLGEEIVDRLNQQGMGIIQILQNPQILDGLNAIKQSVSNEHGPGEAAAMAYLSKRIDAEMAKTDRGQHQPNPHNQSIYEKIREMKAKKAEVGSIAHTIGDNSIKMKDKVGQVFKWALGNAIVDSDVEKVRSLFKEFGSDFISKAIWEEAGMNALHLASLYAKATDLIEFIRETGKFDINEVDLGGRTPLHYAIVGSNAAINARYLLEKGADPTRCDKEGLSPFYLAAVLCVDNDYCHELLQSTDERNKSGEAQPLKLIKNSGYYSPLQRRRLIGETNGPYATTELLNIFLEIGKIDINGRDVSNGETALHFALGVKNVITARYLLEKGADPTISDNKDITPFHLAAAFSRETDILDFILANNVQFNIDHRNQSRMTALHMAISESNTATARYLLTRGANINAVEQNGYTPLHVAAKYAKDMDIVELLLNHKDVDVNYLDNSGHSAMDCAINNEHGLGVAIAVQMGNKVGRVSPTALYRAIKDSDVESVSVLLKSGAHVTALTWGETRANTLHVTSHEAKTTDLIDFILERGKFEINGIDLDGRTPLHYAIVGSNAATNARYLLEKGADPTISDNKGITPFHLAAAFSRETDILDLILANNVQFDIDHRNKTEMTALHMAITESNTAAAKFLLSNGANPNAADQHGYTPLHVAAKYAKDMDIVELLLNHKDVNVNYLDNSGHSALDCTPTNLYGICEQIADRMREKGEKATDCINQPESIPARLDAITNSNVKTTRILKENRLDNATWGENGTNLLHVAAADAKTTDVIDAILETGTFVINGVDNDGDTPLHYAIMGSNSANIVPHLIRLGVDPNVANKTRVTPLHLAAKNEETAELIDIILETGQCDINSVDSDGRTPLHYAIKRPKPITINARRLIKMGADPSIADKNRVTPLHMAARNADSMDLIEILINTGAVDMNCVDKQGRTPLACARDNKHGLGQKIIARLRESGAEQRQLQFAVRGSISHFPFLPHTDSSLLAPHSTAGVATGHNSEGRRQNFSVRSLKSMVG